MNILLIWFLMAMHQNFFNGVHAGVEGNAEVPTVYAQPVEKRLTHVKHFPHVNKRVVIDIHTDEKDEEIVKDDQIVKFDLGIRCPIDVCPDGE